MTAYTPIYNLPYVEASDLVASYPTVSEELAENIETALQTSGGISLITSTTFSAVNSVSVNNCFTSTYENYKIVAYLTANFGWMYMRLRASGADNTTSNYGMVNVQTTTTNSPTRVTFNNVTSLEYVGLVGNRGSVITLDVASPQLAEYTMVSGIVAAREATDASINNLVTFGGGFNATTQFDGFSFTNLSSATGRLAVYGYNS